MIKEKQVTVNLEDGSTVDIVVKKPSPKQLSKAQMLGSKVWTEALKDGIFTKVTLANFMEKEGIWDSSKTIAQAKILQKISALEKEIALGKNQNGTTLKLSEAKDKALELRRLRIDLRELIAEKISLEANTAEGLADNARFNYLVASCTYYANGEKVYKDMDDYNNKADDEVAFSAASALGELVYKLDRSYEESLPENQFLKKYNFVDKDLALIDKEGHRVDVDGTLVNDKGWLVNKDGQRIDRDGNLLNESGNLLIQGDFIDDVNVADEKETKTKSKRSKKEDDADSN